MSDIAAKSQALRQDMSLQNLFRLTSDYGDRIAARYLEGDEEKSVTYAQYERLTCARAAYLRGAIGGQHAGRFVGIQMDTCPDWYSVFWGVIAAGYNALLIDFAFSDEMTAHILEQADAVAVIARGVRTFARPLVQITHRQLLDVTREQKGFAPAFGNMVALCTSGTTDTSRVFVYDGAALCHQVLNSELLHNANKRIIPDSPMVSLAFLPFHHVFGFVAGLLWMSFCGAENIYLHDRSPKTIQTTARRFRVTHLLAVPLLANNLAVALGKKVKKESWTRRAIYKTGRAVSLGIQIAAPGKGLDFARNTLFRGVVSQILGADIKCIILGGSHTPREHMITLSALGYYTVCGFGMTETAITSVETGMNIFRRVSGSVGVPLSSAEYRVQSDGKRSGSGEMFIRGNTIHTGCLKDGKLLPPLLDSEGWFRTGDVVRLEKGSRMYVEGRAKDVIINESGENVYPDEIEDAFGALENVDQYCVLGVRAAARRQRALLPRKKHELNYEDITLVINVGDHYRDDAYIGGIMQKVRQINNRLPTLKRVTRVLATPERFSTAGGIKVKRLALKKDIEDGRIAYRDVDLTPPAGAAAQTPAVVMEQTPTDLQLEEIKRKVRRIYAETLDIPESQVRDDAHFIDEMGGDSLQVLGMSLKVEELFNVLIPTEEYGRCTTVNNLSSLLYARMRGDVAYEKESDQRGENVTPITRFETRPSIRRSPSVRRR